MSSYWTVTEDTLHMPHGDLTLPIQQHHNSLHTHQPPSPTSSPESTQPSTSTPNDTNYELHPTHGYTHIPLPPIHDTDI